MLDVQSCNSIWVAIVFEKKCVCFYISFPKCISFLFISFLSVSVSLPVCLSLSLSHSVCLCLSECLSFFLSLTLLHPPPPTLTSAFSLLFCRWNFSIYKFSSFKTTISLAAIITGGNTFFSSSLPLPLTCRCAHPTNVFSPTTFVLF